MAITTEPQQLLQLLAFLSPAFPVGGFAYSHGLERAIDDGVVTSAEEVGEWIKSLLVHGSGWNDAVLFAQAHEQMTWLELKLMNYRWRLRHRANAPWRLPISGNHSQRPLRHCRRAKP